MKAQRLLLGLRKYGPFRRVSVLIFSKVACRSCVKLLNVDPYVTCLHQIRLMNLVLMVTLNKVL
jgi:hypothetical protein